MAVNPKLTSFVARWTTYGGYMVAFSVQGRRNFRLRVIGVYASPQEPRVRLAVVRRIEEEMQQADARGELLLIAGDMNERDEMPCRPIEETVGACGLLDLAVHLGQVAATHEAGGRLDRVYLSPAATHDVLATLVMQAQGFDHARLALQTALMFRLDRDLARLRQQARTETTPHVLDERKVTGVTLATYVSGMLTDLDISITDDDTFRHWVDQESLKGGSGNLVSTLMDQSVPVQRQWHMNQGAMLIDKRTKLSNEKRCAVESLGSTLKPTGNKLDALVLSTPSNACWNTRSSTLIEPSGQPWTPRYPP